MTQATRNDSTSARSAKQAGLRDFSRSLPMSLLRAREAVMGAFRPHLRAIDLTEQQWRVLRALSAVDSISVLALAEATFLLPPSLSRILRDLSSRNLVRRTAAAQDLRRGVVTISPAGAALIEQAGHRSEAIYAEITRRYGAERFAQLQAMLQALEQAMREPIALDEVSGHTAGRGAAHRTAGSPDL